MADYDIVVLGGGSNSLTAAAYMAKAGKKVLVLEKNAQAGGGTVSIHIAPGFTNDPHATGLVACLPNPAISAHELPLGKHGLELIPFHASFASVFEDGTGLISYSSLDKTCEAIAKFSTKDAEVYRKIATDAIALLPLLSRSMGAPPLPFGGFVAMMEQSANGRRLVTDMLNSVYDVLEENFESIELKLHFMKWCGEMMMNPETKGTGLTFHMLLGMSHSYDAHCVKGGTKNLTNALIGCINEFGGEVRLQSEVKRVVVSGGKATGVEMMDGEVIRARDGVIASIHPWRLGDYIEGLDPQLVDAARRVKLSDHGAINQQFALTHAPEYKAGAEYKNVMCVELMHKDIREARQQFHNYIMGDMDLTKLSPLVMVNSNVDPSRAPPGKAALYLYHFGPREWANGGINAWEERGQEVADAIWTDMKRYCTNMDDNAIIARHVETPLTHHRHSNSMMLGDIFGIGGSAAHLMGRRPIPELARYRVPGVTGLYLSGPFMHPGGAVTLGGRATAMAMCQDFKIDLKRAFTVI
ncbi:NAD(P)/FAD-dependent oxidoreductase [Acidocella sp. KAb 2-4]|uniref:phytoene desaturase family protein n=1 Tax=Acidocella sp. KAb 2-4 TaxID=2885158 RepID=UPI001D07667B|nr:NAD(P)/FAD-dependent oxidoreductase [Acidocella sp. KAb 2-4]MCB5945631.1 NAD(P)/FAD-dependent oxidoreductase [Acidocella sp. KAb 2-4]